MIDKSDWRLNGQEEYLTGKNLIYLKWMSHSLNSKHDHCIFCWEKFSDYEGSLHEGYVTEDGEYWICPSCFEDFQDSFAWSVVDMKMKNC